MKYLLLVLTLLVGCAAQTVVAPKPEHSVAPKPPTGLVNIYGPKCPRPKDPVLAAQELLATRTPDGEIVIEKGVDPKRVIRAIIESISGNQGVYDSCKTPQQKKKK